MIMAVTCKTVSLSDISLSRELGAGAFGLVMLVCCPCLCQAAIASNITIRGLLLVERLLLR
eukprot:m.138904 g.138904  ORF g.138904 m.138904 type:complete len:61 (-) comp16083_c2_seq4:4733-4915(-)